MWWKDLGLPVQTLLLLGAAVALGVWLLSLDLDSHQTSDRQQLCSWVSDHLDCRTWRGAADGVGRR
jgi:hypothetical protein